MESNGNQNVESVKARDAVNGIEKMGFYKLLELIRRMPDGVVIRVKLRGEDGMDGRNESKI